MLPCSHLVIKLHAITFKTFYFVTVLTLKTPPAPSYDLAVRHT